MITAFVLQHPQSSQHINYDTAFRGPVQCHRVACGTARVDGSDLSEAGSFWPTYASWNSVLFETSVILTIWEHADRIIGDNHVAFLHSDVEQSRSSELIWDAVHDHIDNHPGSAVALTSPVAFRGLWRGFLVPDNIPLTPDQDPMRVHRFDHGINVWDFIYRYDPDLYQWAITTQPRIIYSHQFACSRGTFDRLGEFLYKIVGKMRLCDTGLWTPHMFERMIGLFLVRHGGPALHTTAFWHRQSSGKPIPGGHSLYGPRAFRYYKPRSRSGTGVGQS